MSTTCDNLVNGVQCYEFFGGIALINHAFSFLVEEYNAEVRRSLII